MKYFPFRLLIWCILLPPVLYIGSLQLVSVGLEKKYTVELSRIYLSNTPALIQGRERLRNVVNRNINTYLIRDSALYWGVEPNILVTTSDNEIIYPAPFDGRPSISPDDILEVAQENFELLKKGLKLSVRISLAPGSLAGLALLGFYMFVDILVLFSGYKKGLNRARQEDEEKDSKIRELREQERRFTDRIGELDAVRANFESMVARSREKLAQEREKASANEDDLLDEIEALEERLEKTRLLQKDQVSEIKKLREEIDGLNARPIQHPARGKGLENLEKRLRTLYKNLDINDRAIDRIAELSEDMRIKAEETIFQLNIDPSLVAIKRKVFLNGRKTKILEVTFGYNGRLYFRHKPAGGIEVLCVGSKNSQARDLEFLNRV